MNKYYNTDVTGLVKDPDSGAVLNIDNDRLSAYKKQKALAKNSIVVNERLSKVENDLEEIKRLLKEIAKK